MSDNEDEKPGGNKKLIIILVAALAIVLIAGGVVGMTLLNANKAAAEPDPATVPGAVYSMEDPMTLNLADGKFLKVQLALELTKEASEAAGEKAATTFDGSKAQDSAIAVLSTYTYKDLLDAKTKEAARKKLSDEVRARYDGAVMQVYFKQFVMQ